MLKLSALCGCSRQDRTTTGFWFIEYTLNLKIK